MFFAMIVSWKGKDMKKTVVFWTFLIVSMSVANAALTSKGYVDNGLSKKQDTLTGAGAITVNQTDDTISVAEGTQTVKGVVKYGTIPTSSTGSGEALIWVE